VALNTAKRAKSSSPLVTATTAVALT